MAFGTSSLLASVYDRLAPPRPAPSTPGVSQTPAQMATPADGKGTSFQFLGIGNGPSTDIYMGPQYANLSNFGKDPYSSSLLQQIQTMPKFQPISPQSLSYTGGAYTAKDMSKASLPQYDAMRTRLNNQYNTQQQQGQDALDRQFAAMGGGPGNGAQAKQTENLAAGIAQAKGNDLLGVNAAEAQARTDLQQQEAQKEFQSGETAKGYGFEAGKLNQNAGLQAQEFNQQQQAEQNKFQFGANSSLAALDLGYQQAQAEANNNEFNKALSQWQSTHSGGLFGSGGFLGLGIG